MKKIIIPNAKTTVDIDTLPNQIERGKYYGIRGVLCDMKGIIICDMKGIIIREHYQKGLYMARCMLNISEGNKFLIPSNSNLKEFIRTALTPSFYCDGTEYEVFEFENDKELAKWLAAD